MMSAKLKQAIERAKAASEKARSEKGLKIADAFPAPKPTPVSLPTWPNDIRGIPNGILRSGLFGALGKGKREYLQAQVIASVEGVNVLFSGPQLDQADLDVWEQCLHLARTQDLNETIYFKGYSFLKSTGRATGKSNMEWLQNSLRRLMGSVVEIEDGPRAYAGPLIHDWHRDEDSGEHRLKLNPKIARLFVQDGYSSFELKERIALMGQPLALWLHAFFSTHRKPFPIKVETIHRLCGSKAKSISDFKKKLKKAAETLNKSTDWRCSIDKNNLLHVCKKTSV